MAQEAAAKGAAPSYPVMLVTGLSGAGKTTALNVLEDLRFFCVDGLPAGLLPKLLDLFGQQMSTTYRGLALGVDLRQQSALSEWKQAMNNLRAEGARPHVVFLTARPEVLRLRYSATRRPHPLERPGVGLEKAIAEETQMLAEVRQDADTLVDTSNFTLHDLRRLLQSTWDSLEEVQSGMRVHLISFGFKFGVPLEADLLFDLRFLPNPYFDCSLRPLSGKDSLVAEYVLGGETGREAVRRFLDFLLYLLPLYAAEGRYRMTIALGCTGGQHRSVSLTEAIFRALEQHGYAVFVEHRHLELSCRENA